MNSETFLPVPDLSIDDFYGKKGPEGGGWIEYKTVTVIMHSGSRIPLEHETGRTFFISSHQFCDIPMSLAMRISDWDNVDVISKKDAQKYIDMAREKALEVNQDIMAHNAKVKAGQTTFIKGVGRVKLKKKKMRVADNNRPYDHYMNEKRAWIAKKNKKKVNPKKKTDEKQSKKEEKKKMKKEALNELHSEK